jgi:hypothetical protein
MGGFMDEPNNLDLKPVEAIDYPLGALLLVG